MIRVFMNPRKSNMKKLAQSYLIDKTGATFATEELFFEVPAVPSRNMSIAKARVEIFAGVLAILAVA
jgi:hypothetical protein